jgi:hypothetical protein
VLIAASEARLGQELGRRREANRCGLDETDVLDERDDMQVPGRACALQGRPGGRDGGERHRGKAREQHDTGYHPHHGM